MQDQPLNTLQNTSIQFDIDLPQYLPQSNNILWLMKGPVKALNLPIGGMGDKVKLPLTLRRVAVLLAYQMNPEEPVRPVHLDQMDKEENKEKNMEENKEENKQQNGGAATDKQHNSN